MTTAIKTAVKDLKGRLDDKVCVVTGAGSGIGYESAVLFASQGAKVVCADIDLAAAQKTVERIKDVIGPIHLSKHATAIKVDVSKEEEVRQLVENTVKSFGRLDVIFNNAGIMHPHDEGVNTDEKVWDLTLNINLKGVWWGCKYAIEQFKKQDKDKAKKSGGSIINTASFVGLVGSATPCIAYTASKGAVLALTRELAVTHARDGIRVNALCPGPLNTPLLQTFLDTEEKKQRRLVHVPIGRFGEAIEQAYAALFLASDESSFVTGVDFKVDGGLTAAYVTPEGPSVITPRKPFYKAEKEKK
ncbi:6345_t:CDS:2 [Paraglomus occultum]|uniref:6345_t:CDS:1 n=1 Tax=Paraglomus occultum TaxID=144539 RepID=A0A9N8WK76_9GLOM|nr:6345_t:CDS:2 [Paraglomus occultum]